MIDDHQNVCFYGFRYGLGTAPWDFDGEWGWVEVTPAEFWRRGRRWYHLRTRRPLYGRWWYEIYTNTSTYAYCKGGSGSGLTLYTTMKKAMKAWGGDLDGKSAEREKEYLEKHPHRSFDECVEKITKEDGSVIYRFLPIETGKEETDEKGA